MPSLPAEITPTSPLRRGTARGATPPAARRGRVLIVRAGDDLAAVDRGQGPVNRQGDGGADEPDRAVREAELQAARVPAAEGIDFRPIRIRIVAGAVGLLHDVGRDRARAEGTVGIGPGAVRTDLRDVFAREEGVTG